MFSAARGRGGVVGFDRGELLRAAWRSASEYREARRASGAPVLSVEDVHLSFGGVRALEGVGFELRRGEVLAIIGPNGAGKTSLLNVVSGFYRPQRGRVVFEGRDVTGLRPHERARLGLARTFQHSELYYSMTVVENVMIGLEPWRRYGVLDAAFWTGRARRWEEWARWRAELAIDLLDLNAYRHRRVGELPPGVQKRVDLARALAQNPKVILMDEPMSGLSREEKEDVARAIVEVSETRPISFVLVEHDLEVVMDLCDRVVVMESGRVIAEGPPSKVASDPRVIEAYMGD